jgi:hypothetical protein
VDGVQRRKLKSRYGARNRFQEPSLELSSQAAEAGGSSLESIPGLHKRLVGLRAGFFEQSMGV